jgi:GDP-L-fucose synthase
MLNKKSKIYLAGHRGLVGSAILQKLKNSGYKNITTKTSQQLDLRDQKKVMNYFKKNSFQFVIIAAAKVGGIYANNTYKADFIYENLAIQNNIIYSSFLNGIKDLIFLGSTCIYPKHCKQPIKESYLLTGKLEETNDSYAIAKIAGIKMCESYNAQYKTNYKCLMPTNTFGPNDNYDTMNSHFFPALIKKIHNLKMQNKKKLKLWGNGFAKREVIYVNDLADACIYFMNKKIKETFINIGSGKDYSIKQYARIMINNIIPEKNIKIEYDLSKPNGTPRKILDIKLTSKYGWKAKTNLNQAILETYKNFLSQKI